MFKLLFVLNIVGPIMEGICFYGFNKTLFTDGYANHNWDVAQSSFKLIVGLLQAVIGVYLGYSLFKIRKLQLETGRPEELKLNIFVVHFATFVLYMFSDIIYNLFYEIYWLGNRSTQGWDRFIIAATVSVVCSFISQTCFCYIFWSFSEKLEPMFTQKQLQSEVA